MVALADRLSDVADGASIDFLDEGNRYEIGELLNWGSAAGHWLVTHDVSACAMVLTNSAASVASFFGAILSGRQVVSIPLPPRAASVEWYKQFVERACSQANASTLLLESDLIALVPPLEGVNVASYQQALSEPSRVTAENAGFSFVQFTSGSTSNPKGVKLSDAKIVANIDAILEWLEPVRNDNSCSWLPLSHDMGLIGMLLSSCLAATPSRGRGGTLYLMTPEHFLRAPQDWLSACSQFAVTVTSAPNFGLAMAAKRGTKKDLDLSRLRACIVGGEMVNARTLRTFTETFSGSGLSPTTISPAYGLAEAALAVTVQPVDKPWQSLSVNREALADRRLELDTDGIEFVSAGHALAGYEVCTSDGSIGEVSWRGPSVCDAYIGPHELPITPDGRFVTSDLGFISNESLYVVGRADDIVVKAGRNIHAIDMEAALETVGGLRSGRIMTFGAVDDQFVVAAELDPACDHSQRSLQAIGRQIRATVVGRVGVAPDRVLILEKGKLPMTSSGKLRRNATRDALHSADLQIDVIAEL
jgi:acyl-CoA synthetase (AMP-forming)/AMP-acid ligase II